MLRVILLISLCKYVHTTVFYFIILTIGFKCACKAAENQRPFIHIIIVGHIIHRYRRYIH